MFMEPPNDLPFFLVCRGNGLALTVDGSLSSAIIRLKCKPLDYSEKQKFFFNTENSNAIECFSARDHVLFVEGGVDSKGSEIVMHKIEGTPYEQWRMTGEEIITKKNQNMVMAYDASKCKFVLAQKNGNDFQCFDIIYA